MITTVPARRRLDGVGALDVAVALLALVFGVIGASSQGWGHPRVQQALAVGVGALVAFVWWERRVADPLLDMSLFRSRPLNAALLNGTLIALVMGGAILNLMYFFQNVQGLKPVPALLRIVPMVIVAAACSPFVGGIMARRGPRPLILGGLAVMVAGYTVLAFLRSETPYPVVVAALALIGAGNIAVITPVTEIVLSSVPAEGMERQFEEAFRAAFTVGVARVFAVAAVVSLACAALAWFGIRPLTTAAQGERS